jgi:hypothetical protein
VRQLGKNHISRLDAFSSYTEGLLTRCGYSGCKADFCGRVRASATADSGEEEALRASRRKAESRMRLFQELSSAEQIVGILIGGGLRFTLTEILFGVAAG